ANHPTTQRTVETCADREQRPLPCCRFSTEPITFGLAVSAIRTVPATAAWRPKRKISTRGRRSDNSASTFSVPAPKLLLPRNQLRLVSLRFPHRRLCDG